MRIMKDWKLARRDLLKGLGVGVGCLPLLRATKSWGDAAAGSKFMVLQMSEGLRMAAWKPAPGALAGQTLPFASAAFEAYKNEMVFISGLSGGGGGGHGSYGCVYSGLGSAGGGQYKEPTGPSIDQVVATGLGASASGRPSLALHVQLERAPRSTTAAGGSRCFWAGAGKPINPVGDPFAVYKEIFAGGEMAAPTATPGSAVEVTRLMAQKKSILDYVGSTLEDFKSRLGTEDREAIGAHHQSIRELEKQLTSAPVDSSKCGGSPGTMIDVNDGASYPLIMKAHTNLMIAALKCGVTKVTTLQTGDSSGNNINFAFVPGIPERSKNNYKSPFRNWHDLGHNPVMDGTDHKRIVDKWYFDRWVEMFAAMKAVPENGGTLFDNTLILIGNHVEDGANHNSNAIPWMLAGKGAGAKLNLGTHVAGGGGIKAANAAIATALGIANQPYGAPLNGVLKG
jgi:hypothetical protein